MDTRIRMHLERAQRVADFSREHPWDVPGYEAASQRLEERLTRALALVGQEFTGRRTRQAAVAKRLALRAQIASDLQLIAGIARTAGKESVGAPIVLRFPGPRQNQLAFLTGARQAVEAAGREAELLTRYGLPEGLLTTVSTRLDEFARLMQERDEASRGHVFARADLRAMVKDVKVVVDQLHTLNRHRFRTDGAARAAWDSSRALRVPTRAAGSAPIAELSTGADPLGAGHSALALPPGESTRH